MIGLPGKCRVWGVRASLILAGFLLAGAVQAENLPGLPRRTLVLHHASTVQEGLLRGWADLISAEGEREVNRASAALIRQHALEQALAVRQKRIQAWWDVKKRYQARRIANRVAPEKIARFNEARKPQPLPLEAMTARIHWPPALRGSAFAAERAILDDAWRGRSSCRCLLATRDRMLATHQQQVSRIPPMQYIAARRFIESLAFELVYKIRPPAGDLAVRE